MYIFAKFLPTPISSTDEKFYNCGKNIESGRSSNSIVSKRRCNFNPMYSSYICSWYICNTRLSPDSDNTYFEAICDACIITLILWLRFLEYISQRLISKQRRKCQKCSISNICEQWEGYFLRKKKNGRLLLVDFRLKSLSLCYQAWHLIKTAMN